MALRPYRPDIVVYNAKGDLRLTIRVNVQPDLHDDLLQFYHSEYQTGTASTEGYFLVATPHRFYLWLPDDQSTYRQPDYMVDVRTMLQPNFERVEADSTQIDHDSLKLLLSGWLYEVMNTAELSMHFRYTAPWLIESALANAIRGGVFALGTVV
jgi:hypothetical protein